MLSRLCSAGGQRQRSRKARAARAHLTMPRLQSRPLTVGGTRVLAHARRRSDQCRRARLAFGFDDRLLIADHDMTLERQSLRDVDRAGMHARVQDERCFQVVDRLLHVSRRGRTAIGREQIADDGVHQSRGL